MQEIKQNGKVFISILHPCFKGEGTKWRLNNGSIELLVSDYHNPKEWIGEIKGLNAPILYRHRTLSDYIKAFIRNSVTFISYAFVGSIYYLRIKHFLPIQIEMKIKDVLYAEGKLCDEDNIENKKKRMNHTLLFLIILTLSFIVILIRFMIK